MRLIKTLLLPCFVAFLVKTEAQTNSVTIINSESKKTVFSISHLKSFPQTNLKVEGEDGVLHNYTGVDLYDLLTKAGTGFGKDVRKQTLNSYMLVKATDDYSVIYALAEVDSFMSKKQIIVAYEKDGKPLPNNFGPLQLIATGEKKHARLIRMVHEIYIRKAD